MFVCMYIHMSKSLIPTLILIGSEMNISLIGFIVNWTIPKEHKTFLHKIMVEELVDAQSLSLQLVTNILFSSLGCSSYHLSILQHFFTLFMYILEVTQHISMTNPLINPLCASKFINLFAIVVIYGEQLRNMFGFNFLISTNLIY